MARRLELCWVLAATVLGCSGDPGAPGAKGDAGEKGDKGDSGGGTGMPSLSAVVPESVFLARTIDVTLSGSDIAWADSVKADFGEKIIVNKLTVASPTALVANITVSPDAATGLRDITVADGASALVYKGAFAVASPLKVEVTGTPAQGSIFLVHARGLDFETPFDTTPGGSIFNPTYPNITLVSSPGSDVAVSSVAEYTVDYQVFVDVNAAASPVKADILSGPKEDVVEFPSPAAYTIAPRSAKPLTSGTTTKISLKNPGDSVLLSFVPSSAALRIIDVSSNTSDVNATPAGYFLPSSGKFADKFAIATGATFASSAASTYYAVYADFYAYGGYDLNVKVTETSAQGGVEKEPNDSKNMATTNGAVALPWVTQSATLKDGTDEDWYAVTIGAADVGKSIQVQTSGLDPLTDTVVDIFEVQSNTLIPIGPKGDPSEDNGFLDELMSIPTTVAGTHFVKVSASAYFDPGHKAYDVIIRIK
jgi:hypothetical protein